MAKTSNTGIVRESKLIALGPGKIQQLLLWSDGVHDAKLMCYDAAFASTSDDSCIAGLSVPGASLFDEIKIDAEFSSGLYCELSGDGAYYLVVYEKTFEGVNDGNERK